jgi:hypothetical protein
MRDLDDVNYQYLGLEHSGEVSRRLQRSIGIWRKIRTYADLFEDGHPFLRAEFILLHNPYPSSPTPRSAAA